MNENIKRLPAEDVKKMLLSGQADIDRMDEEMLLYLLDYEVGCAAGKTGKTKFYKMCVGALSKFIDCNVRDEELDAVVSSAYFLCFNKREQKRLLKRLQEKNGQSGIKAKAKRPPYIGEWIVCAVAFLLLTAFLIGTVVLYSERISGTRNVRLEAMEMREENHLSELPDDKEFIKGIDINTDGKQKYKTDLKNVPIPKVQLLTSGFETYICGDRI